MELIYGTKTYVLYRKSQLYIAVVVASKEAVLWRIQSKLHMFLSRVQTAGQSRNLKMFSKFFENMTKFNYLGNTKR